MSPRSRAHRHHERHSLERVGWLRAAVLGANDGIVSTSSLILGVASAQGYESSVLLAGAAGVVAGAMSMAAGEYVSVHSQQDLESAALAEEREELKEDAQGEHEELTAIYVRRGLERDLAEKVATQLSAHDALGAHARDELGITRTLKARPLQAAVASAVSFATGGVLPLVVAWLAQSSHPIPWVAGAALVLLAILGAVSAKAGNAPVAPSVARVVFWSAFAMAVTSGVGMLFSGQA
ncbi:MAG TPA: VIT family protein [Usitatibacter sp.]|nr:VIT family protein [Usitatibacter sp.]